MRVHRFDSTDGWKAAVEHAKKLGYELCKPAS